ncbi:hypothetical protein [Chryseotalea sanaruensis]|nr:hypothetical protein [Chryseotalea sanaruensis]
MKKLLMSVLLVFGFVLAAQAQTVYSSAKGEKYHTADCRLSGDAEGINIDKAKKAGKKACDVCKPNELGKAALKQCEGKTKEGVRCKRMTASKGKKCYQHQTAK